MLDLIHTFSSHPLSWKHRYFTLKSNGDLAYYEGKTSAQSLGSVLITCHSTCSTDPKSPLHFTLQANAQARKYDVRFPP